MRAHRLWPLINVIVGVVWLSTIAPASTGQQGVTRDAPAPVPTGTAVVAGVVLTNEARPSPVRRARVTLRADGATAGWSETTDDEGRFAIRNVPAGAYTIEASKAAWITSAYGATRPGRPGTPITVVDGGRIPGIAIRMSRGGVLTGTVVDRAGLPVPGVSVSAMRFTFSELSGERTLRRPAGGTDSVTDDQGVFRSFGLPPGEYVVAATLRAGAPTALTDLRPLTDAEVDRALRTGAPAAATPASLVGFAPVYFPGTAHPERALPIALGLSEERAGVNIRLEPVPTARIDVLPTLPGEANSSSLQVFLVPAQPGGVSTMVTGRREADGRYVFSGVTPGDYTVLARAARVTSASVAPPAAPAGRGRGTAAPLTLYASVSLHVDGRDSSVPLEVRPGMTVSGRLAFAGDVARVPKETISLALLPVREAGALGVSNAPIDAAGSFRFEGVPPGRYRVVQATGPTGPFQIATAILGDRDVLDTWLDVRADENLTGLAVTFTDQVSEVSGRLETAAGAAAPAYFIVAFAADRSFWTPLSRRVRQARPATDGRFSIRGLPAGDYFIAALTDVEPGEWYAPAFLAQLLPAAVKITVREGQQTQQDLRIK